MPRYQIKPGFFHGKNNEHGAGDVVELSAYEAAPIGFKLIPLDSSPTDAPAPPGLVDDRPAPVESGPAAVSEPSFDDVFGQDAAKLKNAGLLTIQNVLDYAEELEELPDIGPATAKRIRAALANVEVDDAD